MIDKQKYLLLFFAFLLAISKSYGQPDCYFEHFSTIDGLPQFTINDIVQDNKGFIWLATYDGLSKFDGYEFHNYKAQSGDSIQMKSNRVDKVHVDKYNRIWMESTGEEVHCFNPKTEKFWGLTADIYTGTKPFILSKIQVLPSGKVWLLSNQDGCICIVDSLFNSMTFDPTKNDISDGNVNQVYEDKVGNSWLLTAKGLTFLSANKNGRRTFYFSGQNKDELVHAFYSVLELENEIWFGTDEGVMLRYLKIENVFIPLQIQAGSRITAIEQLDLNTIFFATQHNGFYTYNTQSRKLSEFNHRNVKGFQTANISITHVAKAQKIWFSNNNLGIYQLDLSTRKLDYYFVETDDVSIASFPSKAFILTDKNNQLWVHPHGGGFSFYDEKANQLKPFYNVPFSDKAKFSNMLHSGYFDRQGNLWLGTRSHGLEKIVFNKNYFNTIKVEPNSNTLFANSIRVLFCDNHQNLWVSSKDNKVYIYNSDFEKIGCLSPDGNLNESKSWPNTVYTIFQDSKGAVWLGTRGAGLYQFKPTNNLYSFRVEHYQNDAQHKYSISDNNIYSIYEDKQQRLWIATFGGGLNLVENTDRQTRFIHRDNRLSSYPVGKASKVRIITEDHQGHICVGTTDCLIMFNSNFESEGEIDFRVIQRVPGNENSLSNNDVIDIQITKARQMFLATSGGGLNLATLFDNEGFPYAFKAYTKERGMPSDVIVSITEDYAGKLWVGCENALCRFDPKNEYFEVFTDVGRLLKDNSFSEATKCLCKSGKLILGYSNGMVTFFPEEIKTDYYQPYLALSNFQIFNKKIMVNSNSLLKTDIDDCSGLILNHKQNFFSIEYAALDFINPRNIQYEYKLEGLDQVWYQAGTKRIANYTNVPKGEYQFKVRSTNGDGVWVENERILPIVIKPSFWETPFAYALYFLIFAFVIFLIDYNLLTIYRLKSKVVLEKKMSDMKQKFFVDISHEIRTPLTMITAPVEYMLNDVRTPEPMKKQLSFIHQNSNRMLRLVNQILDMRKLEDIKLKIQELDIAPIIYEIFNGFTELAKENQIDFQFKNRTLNDKIWADKDSLEKIVINLLSNAFKYTPKGKSITMELAADEKSVTIKVSDKGTGISKDKQKKLFVRFMSFNDDPNKPSTGIGLALVKELADKHSASVSVESEAGKGSCFAVSFKKGNSHFNENVEFVHLNYEKEKTKQIENKASVSNANERSIKPKVLLVEDETDLRNFIKSILNDEYEIVEADNGYAGYELAITHQPDFIISDIMMPRMDGIELLKKIRNDINTSHIPLILLTAKTNIESKLDGLNYGADDYIIKPFSVPYFKTRISNLIEQRKRLQMIFSKAISVTGIEYYPKPCLISNQDEDIMEKVMTIIEGNMENVNFTVEELALTVGINRTTFQNKIKSLTGFSPVEFIRDIRLKRAAQLIAETSLLIKEISYMTGFTDTRYFGKCFKVKYGVTPLEYRNKEKVK